jgi:Tfp pilus assembly protein FimV
MSKFIVSLVFAAGLCGPAGAATIVQTSSDTAAAIFATEGASNLSYRNGALTIVQTSSDTPAAIYATEGASNLPYQVDELQAEVKALGGQVSTLQSTSIVQNDQSAAQLDTIGTGG